MSSAQAGTGEAGEAGPHALGVDSLVGRRDGALQSRGQKMVSEKVGAVGLLLQLLFIKYRRWAGNWGHGMGEEAKPAPARGSQSHEVS